MSNLFVPPKSTPPTWLRDPGLPKFDAARNNEILRAGMQGAQPDVVWDALVKPKGLKPLASLLYSDLGPYSRLVRRGKKSGEDGILPGKTPQLNARTRDSVAATVTAEIMDDLRANAVEIERLFGDELMNVDDIATALSNVCAWRDVAPTFSLGRLIKYLSAENVVGLAPPSFAEVDRAARELGLPTKLPAPKLITSFGVSEADVFVECVTWNKKATAGLPFLCRGDKSPEIFEEAAALAEHVYAEMKVAYKADPINGVKQKYRQLCQDYPGLMTNIGKTKSENVDLEKAKNSGGRFYNASPLWSRLLLSTVSQVFEEHSLPYGSPIYGEEPGRRSIYFETAARDFTRNTQGLSFFNGGARRYVLKFSEPLNEMARRHQESPKFSIRAFSDSNCGDDSDFAMFEPKMNSFIRMMFDMSSFDLTQHWLVLKPVADWLCGVLSTSDPILGQLWREVYTYRPTWIMGSMMVLMKCGGPSGLQLQSKVNALLMRVYLMRFRTELSMGRFTGPYTQEGFNGLAKKVADRLGFVVKLEQFRVFPCEAFPRYELTLADRPVRYLGYDLWLDLRWAELNEWDRHQLLDHNRPKYKELAIWPTFDLNRLLVSLPYPAAPWEEENDQFALDRWIRLASLYYTCGVPPDCTAGALTILRRFLLQEIKKLRNKGLAFDQNRRVSFWDTNLASAGPLPDATFTDLPAHVGSLLARLGTPVEDIWDLDPPERMQVPLRAHKGPFLREPRRLTPDRLPPRRPSVTRTGLSRANFGRPPPLTPWAPPTERGGSSEKLSARALRKEHPRAIAEYHESAFQVMDDDEYGGELPRRNRRGRGN